MTFNSVNKWAAGIADTFALGLLTEALGEGQAVVIAPWAKSALTSHPAFAHSIEMLRSIGACVIQDDRDRGPLDGRQSSPGKRLSTPSPIPENSTNALCPKMAAWNHAID
jgi:phosphopantothenoylcysteine synthetase/decarboxylase